jgi:hypothetical protein
MTYYLAKLKGRMFHHGFPADDEWFVAAERAHNAMHSLAVRLHYMACGHGVGRKAPQR